MYMYIYVYIYMHLAHAVVQLVFLISAGELSLLAHTDLPAAWNPVVCVFYGSWFASRHLVWLLPQMPSFTFVVDLKFNS